MSYPENDHADFSDGMKTDLPCIKKFVFQCPLPLPGKPKDSSTAGSLQGFILCPSAGGGRL